MFKYLSYLISVSMFASCSTSTLQSLKRSVGGEPEKVQVSSSKSSKKKRNKDKVNYTEEEVMFDDSYVPTRQAHNPLKDNDNSPSGSIWEQTGQQNFLFSRNMQKNVGDLVTIKIEDKTKKQLTDEYEAEYINITTQKEQGQYISNLLGEKDTYSRAEVKKMLKKSAKNSEKLSSKKKASKSGKNRILSSDEMTARVVQLMQNGSYKIQGIQAITLSKKPYKMILSGLIKASDIEPDDSVLSSRLINTQVKFVKGEETESAD